MSQSALIVATEAGATSAEFTVTTTPVTLTLFSEQSDGAFGPFAVVAVLFKTPGTGDGQWQRLRSNSSENTLSSTDNRQMLLLAPGTYKVTKPATPGYELGVALDTTA